MFGNYGGRGGGRTRDMYAGEESWSMNQGGGAGGGMYFRGGSRAGRAGAGNSYAGGRNNYYDSSGPRLRRGRGNMQSRMGSNQFSAGMTSGRFSENSGNY
ncbi:hypothetical protein Ciccas_008516 [Cichlidogyrus casuarinus]|uniref:Uncharacterized protein n=1 Tax=Cichlidogyrus casuarinus TaxID=1844966 RepID=A0ABD2Q0J1_9PLAT